jgi:uncharacterized membrane protein
MGSLALSIAVTGAVLLLLPSVKRGILFAVPVDAGLRSTRKGQLVVVLYRAWCLLALAAALGLCLLSPQGLPAALSPLMLLVAGIGAFFVARRMVLPFIVHSDSHLRAMDLSSVPDQVPRWIWLGIGPFVLLGMSAFFLSHHWGEIPQLVPVHFAAGHAADRWAQKSFKGVFGSLLFGCELCVWFVVVGLGSWYGARRSSMRRTVLAMIVVVEYLVALMFSTAAIQPVAGLPEWLPVVFVLLAPVALLAIFLSSQGEPSESARQTPEECWKAGMLYVNPNDPVLFVEKRIGVGYTINFGNPVSWWFCAGLIAVVASAPVILP